MKPYETIWNRIKIIKCCQQSPEIARFQDFSLLFGGKLFGLMGGNNGWPMSWPRIRNAPTFQKRFLHPHYNRPIGRAEGIFQGILLFKRLLVSKKFIVLFVKISYNLSWYNICCHKTSCAVLRTTIMGKARAHEVLRIMFGCPEGARTWRILYFCYAFA